MEDGYMKNLLIVLIALATANFAFANISQFQCAFPDDPMQMKHSWNFNNFGDLLTLTADVNSLLGYDHIEVSGSADTNPSSFLISETVTNSGGSSWSTFELIFDPYTVGTFAGPVSSDKFESSTISNGGHKLVFSAGDGVLSDETVSLNFRIDVTNTMGQFHLNLSQIPEPATITLICIGAVALLRKIKEEEEKVFRNR